METSREAYPAPVARTKDHQEPGALEGTRRKKQGAQTPLNLAIVGIRGRLSDPVPRPGLSGSIVDRRRRPRSL